jgi:hypothetical protein
MEFKKIDILGPNSVTIEDYQTVDSYVAAWDLNGDLIVSKNGVKIVFFAPIVDYQWIEIEYENTGGPVTSLNTTILSNNTGTPTQTKALVNCSLFPYGKQTVRIPNIGRIERIDVVGTLFADGDTFAIKSIKIAQPNLLYQVSINDILIFPVMAGWTYDSVNEVYYRDAGPDEIFNFSINSIILNANEFVQCRFLTNAADVLTISTVNTAGIAYNVLAKETIFDIEGNPTLVQFPVTFNISTGFFSGRIYAYIKYGNFPTPINVFGGQSPQLLAANTLTPAEAPSSLLGTNNVWQGTQIFSAAVSFAGIGYMKAAGFPNPVTYSAAIPVTDVSGALAASNNLSDLTDTAVARNNLGLGSLSSVTFADLLVTGTTTLKKLLLQKTIPAGGGSEILVSSELGLLSSNGDSGAIRGYCAAGAGSNNHFIRAIEAQCSRQAGAGAYATWGIEVGLHSEVAGTGTSNIGVACLSSHTGWTPTGVRNDIGIHVAGEDGWKYGYTYYDVDNATVLYSVDEVGLAYAKTAMFGAKRADQLLTSPRVCLQLAASGAAATETRFSIYYDAVNNQGVIEALTQGTAWRNLLLAPSGGNILVGTAVAEDTTHRLQVGGPVRSSQFIVNRVWTDNANLERIWFGWSGTAGRIHVESLGTGVARALGIYADAGIFFSGAGAAVNHWSINTVGHLIPMTTNAYNIGSAASLVFRVHAKDYLFRSGAADPVATDIPATGFLVWKNTTSGEIRVWANDAGTLKKSGLIA